MSFTILEASLTLMNGVYITGVSYNDHCHMFIVIYFQEPAAGVEHLEGASLGLEPSLLTNIALG